MSSQAYLNDLNNDLFVFMLSIREKVVIDIDIVSTLFFENLAYTYISLNNRQTL